MMMVWDWDRLIQAFEMMYKQMKDGESENSKNYVHHALGMLKLIPQIREVYDLEDFELTLSLGALVIISKAKTRRRVRVSCGKDVTYYVETYDQIAGHSGNKKFDSLQIVLALHGHYKEFLTP
jgi:hypothetical protein